MKDFDTIVIGSGFGGAITACRLQEAGYRVLVLERGRRWSFRKDSPDFFPRDVFDKKRWLWRNQDPVNYNGWLDLRLFRHMAVAQGAAVGGGSQIYANVSVEAPEAAFEDYPGLSPWPRVIRKSELQKHYDSVASEMKVKPIPMNQWSSRTGLVKAAAEAIGEKARFRTIPLAINFQESLVIDPASPNRPHRDEASIRPNEYGVLQGTCYHCGQCDIGCDINARNTLDTNYIPRAERAGAEVRALHIVRNIEPISCGYRVYFERINGTATSLGSVTARLVVVAAGSLGSTELLLRCREQTGSLPAISPRLGRHWTSNGDFLTPTIYSNLHPSPNPSEGPPITAVIDFLDRSRNAESFWIQDGGFPNLLAQYLKTPSNMGSWMLLAALRSLLSDKRSPSQAGEFQSVMPWFAQAVDAGDGVMRLKRRWWWPFGNRELCLDWDVTNSQTAIDTVVAMHKRLAEATGGLPLVPPSWSIAKDLITPHPLGGCAMADAPELGVVNDRGEVFGYKNLYVSDGAIFPRAIGVNPSRTIGALAERIAAKIIERSN